MVWTDIFIKRPVLAVVVEPVDPSDRAAGRDRTAGPAVSEIVEYVVNVTTVYPGAAAPI